MRAICETCEHRQPTDWRPGDLCVHCGRAVREENRCYWCARWVPAGNFCRGCGAEGIPPDQYAPARMMKFYGADMFSIPRLLREMDPERIATFRAVYGRHQAVALRHVEEVRELETELFDKRWSAELEDRLIAQLPWDDKQFEVYAKPETSGVNSPFAVTRALTTLVALRRGDFTRLRECLSMATQPDPLGLEAALQVANWRVAGNTYLEEGRYGVLERLRAVPDPKPAMVCLSLAYIGDRNYQSTAPAESITSTDPELRFFAGLQSAHEEILEEGLRSTNPLQQNVAALNLIRIGRADLVCRLLAQASPERQKRLLDEINLTKKPVVPELKTVLYGIISACGPEDRISQSAARAICLGGPSRADALRLAEFREPGILHMVAIAGPDPETCREIGEMLVREDKISTSHFAWNALSAPGRLPQNFAELIFTGAPTARAQCELLRLAEKQLEQIPDIPPDTSMERLLIHTAFGDHDPSVIAEAWAGMHRINYRREYGSISPFPYRRENIEKFWPMHEFEHRLARLQANEEALKGTFVRDELDRFLRSRDR